MAKAAKATETNKTVPAAEVVGGPLPNQNDANQNGTAASNDANSSNTSQAVVTSAGAENTPGSANDLKIAIDRATYAHLAAAMDSYLALHGDSEVEGIRITAKIDGLRRGGIRHVGTSVHPTSKFEPYQLNQILGDPDLVTELVELDD